MTRCRCGHTAEHHAMQGRNAKLSFCVEQCCPCEEFRPHAGWMKRVAFVLSALALLGCSGATADPGCPKASPDQCAYMQNQCESYCAHKCLGQEPCESTCWADECVQFEQACPTTCEQCVPTFTADGPQTVCTPPVAP